MTPAAWQLFDREGRRKYVNPAEFRYFLAAAEALPLRANLFCQLLAYAGCRISEALALCPHHIGDGEVVFRTLKRRRLVHRVVQVPKPLTDLLRRLGDPARPEMPLWRVARSTAYRWVKKGMRFAAIGGRHASPKGLRHCFGARYALAGAPLPLIQKWLGHASIRTTAIYLDPVGPEERRFAERAW